MTRYNKERLVLSVLRIPRGSHHKGDTDPARTLSFPLHGAAGVAETTVVLSSPWGGHGCQSLFA